MRDNMNKLSNRLLFVCTGRLLYKRITRLISIKDRTSREIAMKLESMAAFPLLFQWLPVGFSMS